MVPGRYLWGFLTPPGAGANFTGSLGCQFKGVLSLLLTKSFQFRALLLNQGIPPPPLFFLMNQRLQNLTGALDYQTHPIVCFLTNFLWTSRARSFGINWGDDWYNSPNTFELSSCQVRFQICKITELSSFSLARNETSSYWNGFYQGRRSDWLRYLRDEKRTIVSENSNSRQDQGGKSKRERLLD